MKDYKQIGNSILQNIGNALSCLFILTMIVLIFRHWMQAYNLKTDHVEVNGKVISVSGRKRSGVKVKYIYDVGGKRYEGIDYFPRMYKSKKDRILNKIFPVAVDPNNIAVSQILITPDDFRKFSIPFPDSLQWVKEIYEHQTYEK